MAVEMSDSLRSALDAEGTPLRVVDTRTNAAYVLISAKAYDRVQGLLSENDDGLSDQAVARLIQENMAEDDALDPLLESYQNYRA